MFNNNRYVILILYLYSNFIPQSTENIFQPILNSIISIYDFIHIYYPYILLHKVLLFNKYYHNKLYSLFKRNLSLKIDLIFYYGTK